MPSWSRLRGVAPFDTLPVELISYIFLLAIEPEPDHQSSDDAPSIDSENPSINMEVVTFPLVLSTVSTRWRTIALSTPALWASICVSIQHVVDLDDNTYRPMLDTTHLVTNLSLSGRSPLNILIDARDPDWDFTEHESVSSLRTRCTHLPILSIVPFANYLALYICLPITIVLPSISTPLPPPT
jgi:hypothetical protein